MHVRFQQRRDAGRALAERLQKYSGPDTVVFGIGAGGLAVAAEVARQLKAPLDLLLVQTLNLPCDELTILGAIAPGGACVLDDALVDLLDVEHDAIGSLRIRAEAELITRDRDLRDGRPWPDVRGRTVVVVDDLMANAMPMHAALLSLHQNNPRGVVVAAPLATRFVFRDLSAIASEVIAMEIVEIAPDTSRLYEHETVPSDTEVRRMLGLSELQSAASTSEPSDEQ